MYFVANMKCVYILVCYVFLGTNWNVYENRIEFMWYWSLQCHFSFWLNVSTVNIAVNQKKTDKTISERPKEKQPFYRTFIFIINNSHMFQFAVCNVHVLSMCVSYMLRWWLGKIHTYKWKLFAVVLPPFGAHRSYFVSEYDLRASLSTEISWDMAYIHLPLWIVSLPRPNLKRSFHQPPLPLPISATFVWLLLLFFTISILTSHNNKTVVPIVDLASFCSVHAFHHTF